MLSENYTSYTYNNMIVIMAQNRNLRNKIHIVFSILYYAYFFNSIDVLFFSTYKQRKIHVSNLHLFYEIQLRLQNTYTDKYVKQFVYRSEDFKSLYVALEWTNRAVYSSHHCLQNQHRCIVISLLFSYLLIEYTTRL